MAAFDDVLPVMRLGGGGTREAWPGGSILRMSTPGQGEPAFFVSVGASPHATKWIPTQKDILATDWRML